MKFLLSFISALLFTTALAKEPKVSLDPKRTIILEGPIGGEALEVVSYALDKLAKEKDKPIDLVITSPGGSILAGYLIIDKMDHLRAQGIKFRCFVHTIAASMAFQTLLHCDEKYATPHAILLWHPVRVFWRGALTQVEAANLVKGLETSNKVVLDDLKQNLNSISEENLMYHFYQETLHQAISMKDIAPDFFDYIGSDIGNLYETKVAASTAGISFLQQTNEIMYIHETFVGEK